MAKLITKFKYLKPNARTSVGGYVKYIATREGVDKLEKSFQFAPFSIKQQQLIEKILTDFPDSKEMLEYEDYLKEPTVGNAYLSCCILPLWIGYCDTYCDYGGYRSGDKARCYYPVR